MEENCNLLHEMEYNSNIYKNILLNMCINK